MLLLVIYFYQILPATANNHTVYTVHRGTSLQLHCKVPESQKYICYKHAINNIIAIDSMIPQHLAKSFIASNKNGNYTLTFLNITEPRNGTYTCRMCNDNIEYSSFDVIVLSPPSNPIIKTNPLRVLENQQLELTCESHGGNPAPEFKWLTLNKSFKEVSISTTNNKSVLVLSTVHAEDNGVEFSCSVKNDAINSSLFANMSIDVNYIPKIELLLNDRVRIVNNSQIFLIDGEFANLVVEVNSNPNADYVLWSHNSLNVSTDSELLFANVNKSSEGNYTITVANNIGIVHFDFAILILYPPKVNLSKSAATLNIGDTLELDCRVDSNPKPTTIYWQLNKQNISKALTSIMNYSNDRSTLRIDPVNRNDAGEYTCVAENNMLAHNSTVMIGIGSTTFNLTVKYPPSIATINQKVSAEIGNKLDILCMAKGVPLPKMEWIRDDHSIPCSYQNISGDLVSCFLSITIVLQSSFGKYTCKASNSLSTDSFDILITTKKSPEAPLNISLLSRGYSWIHVCWIEGYDGGMPQTFLVDSCVKHMVTKHNCANVTGITESNVCSVRLSARNAIGMSRRTKQVEFSVQHFPFQSRDMPFLRDPLVEGSDLRFSLSPSKSNLHHSQLCLQVYFSLINPHGNSNVLFDKYNECIALQSESKSSLFAFFSKRSTGLSELRFCVCAVERQNICGSEVAVDVRNIPVRSSLSVKIAALVIILSVIVSAILTLCAICFWKRHPRRKREFQPQTSQNIAKFNKRKPHYLKCKGKENYDNLMEYKISLERAKMLMDPSTDLRKYSNNTFKSGTECSMQITNQNNHCYNSDVSTSQNADDIDKRDNLLKIASSISIDSASESGYSTPTKRTDKVVFEATV
ncbi:hypothetical protein GJ496_001425 [Pomphorhynchus laevis]|nr:hypothetical protein GJ496_001425 [Pomphorhynchus laevis]